MIQLSSKGDHAERGHGAEVGGAWKVIKIWEGIGGQETTAQKVFKNFFFKADKSYPKSKGPTPKKGTAPLIPSSSDSPL